MRRVALSIKLRAALHQLVDHLVAADAATDVQRRLTARVAYVRGGAVGEQFAHHGRQAAERRQMQRRPPAVFRLGVEVRTRVDERRRRLYVAVLTRKHQRRVAARAVAHINIGAC
eukprot:3542060-Pleurochrysis_carterae.AAC.1